MNAAVWFGAAIFFTLAIAPAPFSAEMKDLLGSNTSPYFRGAIAQILIARYFHLQLACAGVAVLHLVAEWLYLGRAPRNFSVGLLAGLAAAALLGGSWFQPRMKELHSIKYDARRPQAERLAADRSFSAWHGAAQGINLLMLAGLAVYLWRMANPADPTRFVSTAKFRS